jgi:hypothetical protein
MNTSTDFASIAASGKPVKIIRAELTLAGATNKEIKELTAGLATKEGWTYSNTLDFLGSELRTQEELYKVILENKSVNEARWISDREKVRALINKVAVKLGAEFTEVLASEALKNQVKALINTKAVKVSEEPGLGLELGESDKPEIEAPKKGKGKK